jgi:hypothetical protein
MLTVLPIRYVADVDASRRFYAGLGLAVQPDSGLTVWAQLAADAGALGIHDAAASQGRPPGTVELGFVTDESLDTVATAEATFRSHRPDRCAFPRSPGRAGGGPARPDPRDLAGPRAGGLQSGHGQPWSLLLRRRFVRRRVR